MNFKPPCHMIKWITNTTHKLSTSLCPMRKLRKQLYSLLKTVKLLLRIVFPLKNRPIIELLFKIYTFCFNNGIIRDRWLKGFISPVFKQGSIYEPLNCRGITLINIICKCDSFMLNNRLCAWIEGNGVLNEEQNGFRHAQSCLDYM